LLETGIGESLFEADTSNHERVGDRSTSDLLDTNITLIQVSIEIKNGIDDHLGEELLILGDNLRVKGGLGTLDKQISLFLW